MQKFKIILSTATLIIITLWVSYYIKNSGVKDYDFGKERDQDKKSFISDFSFSEYWDNETLFSIKAKSLELEDGKIGILKTPLLKKIKIENLIIHLIKKNIESIFQAEAQKAYLNPKKNFSTLDSIKMEKVKAQIKGDNYLDIKSDYAVLDYAKKLFVFSGKITLKDKNSKFIKCSRLNILPVSHRAIATNNRNEVVSVFVF